jgi:hypothetical protein
LQRWLQLKGIERCISAEVPENDSRIHCEQTK